MTNIASQRVGLFGAEGRLEQHAESCVRALEEKNPALLAFVPEHDRRGRVVSECREILERWEQAERVPTLYGVAVGIKDIISVEGLRTRAGSALPPSCFEGEEATCVTRLRDAGAFIMGKTVTAEFACREPGATRNPRNRAHTPGGSSSGSAAAVAAGLCSLALGSQTVGSVIRPAAYCGIVGFKPSYDRIPTDGVLYYSPSVDHVGILASSVQDLIEGASVLLNEWSATSMDDATSDPVLGVPVGRYLQQTERDGLDGFERSIVHLQEAGVEVKRFVALDDIEEIAARHDALTTAEFAQVHAELFRDYGALYRPISANLVERGMALGENEIARGRASRLELRETLADLMAAHGIDAFVCPAATGGAPRGLGHTGNAAMNLPWTHAGMPAVTLPSGSVTAEGGDLPLGLQLVAGLGEDEKLLAIAARLESRAVR
jgi:Asp-tRNA(Asn)/Glu-tRNA(Gln) amidotransferase A subunit family amidase